jgi:hypothetical protein
MKLYYRRSDGVYVATEGMSQEVISAMLARQGLSCEFISEQEFRSATAEQPL